VKRILALLMMLSLLLAGCGSQEAPPSPSPPEALEAIPTVTPVPETQAPATEAPWTPGNNPLTGLEMDPVLEGNRPIAVVMNNLKVALPMCGVSQADVLVEVLAEGGITRMINLFTDWQDVPRFGSIRSARDYFLDVAGGFDAVLVHAGGSPKAYELIKSRGIASWDGVNGSADEAAIYYRDAERKANAGYEHSLFTTGKNIKELWDTTSDRTAIEEAYNSGLAFAQDGTPVGGAAAAEISVRFSSYKTGVFTYDETAGLYMVSQHGKPFVDGDTQEQVGVTNVLTLFAECKPVPGDTSGRISVNLVGEGSGYFACGGKQVAIRWSKSAWDANFQFALEDGSPLSVGCGRTYINIVPMDCEYTAE